MADTGIVGQIDADSGDPLELARALVATPSVNPGLDPDGDGEAAVAGLAAGWLRSWGYDVELVDAVPGRPSVLARQDRGGGRSLVLNGHLDTVGVAGMTIDPFDPVVRDGRLWGRGSADMKGGVAAVLAAARDASRSGFRGALIVALTADEEEEGQGARRLVADGLEADGAVVCEPTGLAVMPAHKGFTWLELTFRGRAAHGSRPERGVDAIRHAGRFLSRLEGLEADLDDREPHPLLGRGSVHAGTIRGGTAPSVYPASCTLTLERRTLPGEDGRAFRAEVERILDGLRSELPSLDVSVELTLHRDGSELAPDHPMVAAVTEAARGAGLEPATAGMSAWVEAVTFTAAGTPALCFGPGSVEDAHSADESVSVDEVRAAHRALRGLVEGFLA